MDWTEVRTVLFAIFKQTKIELSNIFSIFLQFLNIVFLFFQIIIKKCKKILEKKLPKGLLIKFLVMQFVFGFSLASHSLSLKL